MRSVLLLVILFSITSFITAQQSFNDKLDLAYKNAKKGLYWAFENVPESKSSLSKKIILKDNLIAQVKISKEIKGIFVESTGYSYTYTATLKIYRSYDSLKHRD